MLRVILLIMLCFSTNVYSTCRDYSVKHKFDVMNGYPHGRKYYVVDHICPLAGVKGGKMFGIDDVSNMQYQTIKAGKEKDKVERTTYGIKKYCNSSNSTSSRVVYNCVKKTIKEYNQ
jgi:hypothetical protein